METIVELEGVNGEWFTLAGPQAGDRGVYLGTGVTGLFDPPVKVTYEEPGNFPGARYLSHRIMRRDIVFGVEILNDYKGERSWLSRDSEWRKAWSYDRDAKLYVTTQDSGTRYLKVRLGEQPDISLHTDPNGETVTRAAMTVIAGDPFWYEDDILCTATTTKDTRFTPGLGALSKPPVESLTLNVMPGDSYGSGGLNPTDQYIFLKWQLPASQEKPQGFDLLGFKIDWGVAPYSQFTVPDYSFENPEQATRRVKTPGLVYGEDCVIDTDPREEQFAPANGSQLWARTNGVRFRNAVPPYTESAEFKVDVSGCASGEMISLRLPRPWSRPWGLE